MGFGTFPAAGGHRNLDIFCRPARQNALERRGLPENSRALSLQCQWKFCENASKSYLQNHAQWVHVRSCQGSAVTDSYRHLSLKRDSLQPSKSTRITSWLQGTYPGACVPMLGHTRAIREPHWKQCQEWFSLTPPTPWEFESLSGAMQLVLTALNYKRGYV